MPVETFLGGESDRLLLTIDTSSAQGSLALYDGHRLSYRSWAAGRSHTTTMLAEVHHLLEAAFLEAGDIAAIGIAIGPGAFTGLRAGFGVAKGFHLATGVPLVGVSTLEATALPYAPCGVPIVATIGAGRGRLVWAHYEGRRDHVLETQPAKNGTAQELVTELELADLAKVIIAGEIDEDQAQTISGTEAAVIPPPPFRLRQPSSFAELAWRRMIEGHFDDAERLEPIYLSR
jgi:tRNA threonylcarbamoyladenosine biosynthesis protein TsaB